MEKAGKEFTEFFIFDIVLGRESGGYCQNCSCRI